MRDFLKRAAAYIPPVGIYAVMFWLSSRPVSGLPFSPPDVLSHSIEYMALSFFAVRAVGRPLSGERFWLFILVLLFLAALDELHQYWVPTRVWSAWDLIYDTAGVFAGYGARRWWMRLKHKADAGQCQEPSQVP